jgi:hypothetical protein
MEKRYTCEVTRHRNRASEEGSLIYMSVQRVDMSWAQNWEDQPCPAVIVGLGIQPSDFRRRKFLQQWWAITDSLTLVVYHCWTVYKLSVRWVCSSYQVPVTSIHALNFTRFMHLPSPFTRPKSQMTIQFTPLCNCLLDITIAASNPRSTLGW